MEVLKLVLEGDGYEQGFFDHPFYSCHLSTSLNKLDSVFLAQAILFVLFMEGKTLEHLNKKHFLHVGVFLSSNSME